MSAVDRAAEVVGQILAALIMGALLSFLGGWMFMLAVGVAHHEWLPDLPTIGYWWAVLITSLIRAAALAAPASGGDR